MKILFVRSTSGISGAEIYTIRLVEALQQKKVDAQILTNHFPFFQKCEKDHVPCSCIFLPLKEAGTKKEFLLLILWFLYLVPMYLWRIKKIEQGKKFDAIVLESMNEKLFLAPYLALVGYKVYFLEHGPLFHTSRWSLVKRLYVHKTKWAQRIIAVSLDTKKDLLQGGVSQKKVVQTYIWPDVRITKLHQSKQKKNQWTIGFVGGITREKGIETFLDAATSLIAQKNPVRFLIVGTGPLLVWVKKEVVHRGIESSVVFTDGVDDVLPYMRQMDVLYMPTQHAEGISLALLDALASGVMVVTRTQGGTRELIQHGKTGFVCETPRQEVHMLEKIVSGKIHTDMIRNAAHRYVQKQFSKETQVSAFLQIVHGNHFYHHSYL